MDVDVDVDVDFWQGRRCRRVPSIV